MDFFDSTVNILAVGSSEGETSHPDRAPVTLTSGRVPSPTVAARCRGCRLRCNRDVSSGLSDSFSEEIGRRILRVDFFFFI